MIINKDISIIEEVRFLKEANAAEYDYDVTRIICDARQRQEVSKHRIIRQGEKNEVEKPATTSPSETQSNKNTKQESRGSSH